MPFLEVPGARVYYELHGRKPGEAPAIVFVHGAGGNHLSWWQQVPAFMDRYCCLVYDVRGWGRSLETDDARSGAPWPADLARLLDATGIDRATLVAQSMGGWTCLPFAAQHPQRVERLLMCGTHGGLRTPAIDALWREARAAPPPPAGVHPAAGERMAREQPALHFLYVEISLLNRPQSPDQLAPYFRDAPSLSPDDVSTLAVPVLFISGAEDSVIPAAALAEAAQVVPNARLEVVPAAGHSVYFERAERFNELLTHFLGA
jgi:pimeloyl-ACP methyl ester carboxylesterase